MQKVLKLENGDYRLDENSPSYQSVVTGLREINMFIETIKMTDGVVLSYNELGELVESVCGEVEISDVDHFNMHAKSNVTANEYETVRLAQREKGIKKYGKPLSENNEDRDWLREAMEEHIDMMEYLKKYHESIRRN